MMASSSRLCLNELITAVPWHAFCAEPHSRNTPKMCRLRITCEGDAWEAQEVYFLKGRDFQNHHGGVILLGDYVYGGHGPN